MSGDSDLTPRADTIAQTLRMNTGRGESPFFLIESYKCTRCTKSRSLSSLKSDWENWRNLFFHNGDAFADFHDAICRDVFDTLHQSARPVNLEIGLGGLTKAKMKPEVALRNVSAAAADFLRLLVATDANDHARSDRVSVGFRSFQFQ